MRLVDSLIAFAAVISGVLAECPYHNNNPLRNAPYPPVFAYPQQPVIFPQQPAQDDGDTIVNFRGVGGMSQDTADFKTEVPNHEHSLREFLVPVRQIYFTDVFDIRAFRFSRRNPVIKIKGGFETRIVIPKGNYIHKKHAPKYVLKMPSYTSQLANSQCMAEVILQKKARGTNNYLVQPVVGFAVKTRGRRPRLSILYPIAKHKLSDVLAKKGGYVHYKYLRPYSQQAVAAVVNMHRNGVFHQKIGVSSFVVDNKENLILTDFTSALNADNIANYMKYHKDLALYKHPLTRKYYYSRPSTHRLRYFALVKDFLMLGNFLYKAATGKDALENKDVDEIAVRYVVFRSSKLYINLNWNCSDVTDIPETFKVAVRFLLSPEMARLLREHRPFNNQNQASHSQIIRKLKALFNIESFSKIAKKPQVRGGFLPVFKKRPTYMNIVGRERFRRRI